MIAPRTRCEDARDNPVVEDDEAVRRLTLTVLQARGYRILEAFCGHTGLELFRLLHSEINLVLTDVVMPHSGPEMVNEILKLVPLPKSYS